ncbi:heavy metal-associated isoprenylated plant protein 39-like [Andrographis paniculata]|uniref:heavy metal-associated isoprenylated plant protein 39-like n=1 Tax=Andrographis paniculata TaxID=175694 RepID=UPI0021E7CC8C|nr:heavy metal-associated isoprenylated plant protein 39-like [Andrographis paniculata]
MEKIVVLKLDLGEDRALQRKALKTASGLPGINQIAFDSKAKTLTAFGSVDAIAMVCKLRKKNLRPIIILVGPAKEAKLPAPPKEKENGEEKKEEAAAPKKGKGKKKKEAEGKEAGAAKEAAEAAPPPVPAVAMAAPLSPNTQYYRSMSTSFSVSHSMEENPNACVIC